MIWVSQTLSKGGFLAQTVLTEWLLWALHWGSNNHWWWSWGRMNLPVPAPVSKNSVATAWNHTGTCSNISSWISQKEVQSSSWEAASRACMVILSQNFCLTYFSLFHFGFGVSSYTSSSSSKKEVKAQLCVPELLKVCQNLFPMDANIQLTFSRGRNYVWSLIDSFS